MSSTLDVSIEGIPNGSFMTVLDQADGTRIQRGSIVYTDEAMSVTLPIDGGITVKGYVDDSLNPSSNGAYLEGVTVGSVVMFTPLSLFQSGEQGAWYDPSDLSTLYQDAAGTTPVTTDGDPVGLMTDKSGNSNHVTQSVSSKRPQYLGLAYDGVDDFLDTGLTAMGSTNLFADSSEEFFVAIVVNVSNNETGTIISKAGDIDRTFQIFFGTSPLTPSFKIRGVESQTDWGLDDGQDHVIWCNWDGVDMTIGYDNANGIVVPVGSAALNSSERIIIGARTQGTAFHLEGDAGSTIIRDKALSAAEISLITQYLLNGS